MNKRPLADRLSEEARALPGKSHGRFRSWFRKVWDVRGGGLYACGFAVTFAILEAGSLLDDVNQIGLVFDGRVFQFVLNFFIDSFTNTGKSFAWPMYVARIAPPWGAIGLGLGFVLFPIYVKKHIEAWLFPGEDSEEVASVE